MAQAKKAVQNFVSLCTGDKGLGKSSRKPLHYKVTVPVLADSPQLCLYHDVLDLLQGCCFHRIVSGFCCQGGDIVRGTPWSCKRITCPDDEACSLQHCMAAVHHKPLGLKHTSTRADTSGSSGSMPAGDGLGGDSIYGGTFKDEPAGLKLPHSSAGVLSMANSGKHSNTSQFFLTLAPVPQCDGKHVVLGRVTEGLNILQRIGMLL